MDSIIKMKNVNFIYNKGKDNEFHALININIEIYPEEFVIIFGPSGCGKSTMLNVIAGLEIPEQGGSVSVLGWDMMTLTKRQFADYHRKQMGMVFQQYNLITSLTVLDNVALPQIFVNASKRKREKWGLQLLERFGIKKQAYKIPTELSGGQQQRIGIARAIVNNPSMILADEPVGNLDSVSAKNVLDILLELNEKEKKTVILVTHNPENLVYGDRIIYMKDGVVTQEVINREKHKEKKKEEAPKSAAAELSDLMRAYHGLTPEQINILIMPYKAKVFAHHFITTRNMEETKIFEDIMQRRLLGTVTQDELYERLRKPSSAAGVGFDSRTADRIMRRVNRIMRMAYFVYQQGHQHKDAKGRHLKITNEEKSKKVTDYLLNSTYYKYRGHLDPVQVNRLELAVKDRLVGAIQKPQFFEYLDKAFSEGGVGLNRKTAKAITEEIELILILGFGIVQMSGHGGGTDGTGISPQLESNSQEDKSGSDDPLTDVVVPTTGTTGETELIDGLKKDSEKMVEDIDKVKQEQALHDAMLAVAQNTDKAKKNESIDFSAGTKSEATVSSGIESKTKENDNIDNKGGALPTPEAQPKK